MFRNELAQEKNVFRRNDSATVTVLYRHMRSVCQSLIWNASRIYVFVLSAHAAPLRRGFRFGIAGRQQQLRLVRSQYPRRFVTRWPPAEASLRQTLRGQPKPLAVIREQFDGGAAAAAKEEKTSGERIGWEALP